MDLYLDCAEIVTRVNEDGLMGYRNENIILSECAFPRWNAWKLRLRLLKA